MVVLWISELTNTRMTNVEDWYTKEMIFAHLNKNFAVSEVIKEQDGFIIRFKIEDDAMGAHAYAISGQKVISKAKKCYSLNWVGDN